MVRLKGEKMFRSKQVLQEMFPIGYVYCVEPAESRFYCADQVVFDKIEQYYGRGNVRWDTPHHVIAKHNVYHTVNGYIFNGDEWFAVERDGHSLYRVISETELKKGGIE